MHLLISLTDIHAASVLAVNDLQTIIKNLRTLILGWLAGLGALVAAYGGLRLLLSGGDPTQAQAGIRAIKYGALGFGMALLGPVIIDLLKWVVGA